MISVLKNIVFILVISSTLVYIGAFGSDYFFLKKPLIEKKELVGKIGDKKIYVEDVDFVLRSRTKDKDISFLDLSPDSKKAIFDSISEHYVWLIAAERKGIHKNPEIDLEVKAYRNFLVRNKYLAQVRLPSFSEDTLREIYDEKANLLEGKEQYRYSTILLKSKSAADEVIKQLKNEKADFAEIAKKYSSNSILAERGGDVGFIIESDIKPKVLEALKNLDKGGISAPIEINNVWVIVKYTDKRDPELLPFESAKKAILNLLLKEEVRKHFLSLQKNIRSEYLWEEQ